MPNMILADAIRRQVLKGDMSLKKDLVLSQNDKHLKKAIIRGYVKPRKITDDFYHWYDLTDKGLRVSKLLRDLEKDNIGKDEALFWYNYK